MKDGLVVNLRKSEELKFLYPPFASSVASISAISSFLSPSGIVTHISKPLAC